MMNNYSKKFLALALLFFCAGYRGLADEAEPADGLASKSPGSLSLELDAAKEYLSALISAGIVTDAKEGGSVDIHYGNTRSGAASDLVKSWDLGLDYSRQGETFSGSLGASYGADDLNRKSLGAKLSLGATWEYAEGNDLELSIAGGPTRLSAADSTTISAGVLKKRTATVNNSVTITQWSPGATLTLSFFDDLFSVWGAYTHFRYQDFSAGSGLAGSPQRSAAAADLKDTLVGGFIDWDWSLGASLRLPWHSSLSGSYCESLDLESQNWSKSVAGSLSKTFGKSFNALLGITHATEGGSGENTVKAGLTYNF